MLNEATTANTLHISSPHLSTSSLWNEAEVLHEKTGVLPRLRCFDLANICPENLTNKNMSLALYYLHTALHTLFLYCMWHKGGSTADSDLASAQIQRYLHVEHLQPFKCIRPLPHERTKWWGLPAFIPFTKTSAIMISVCSYWMEANFLYKLLMSVWVQNCVLVINMPTKEKCDYILLC